MSKSTEIEVPQFDASFGLGDFKVTDLSVPRVQIMHSECEFEDKSTGQTYEELEGVGLGLVNQRILWDAIMREDQGPLCSSLDSHNGTPGDAFPWEASGFKPTEGGLSCDDCKLKEWGSHPTRDTPWCAEQYVIPFMTDLEGSGVEQVVILTFKGSGISAAKKWIGMAVRANQPLFANRVRISLQARKNGSVRYAVPAFDRGKDTEPQFWRDYADNFLTTEKFLKTPRNSDVAVDLKANNTASDDDEMEEF